MNIDDLLIADNVLAAFKASSKKQTLQTLTRHLATFASLDARDVFEKVLEREKLGTTGVGKGVAIPHARIEELDHMIGLFARLDNPIEFDSVDDRPIDLVFMLLAPIEAGVDHLKALAKVSRLLRDEQICDRLRETSDHEALFAILTHASREAA